MATAASLIKDEILRPKTQSPLDDPCRINVEVMTETVRKAIEEQIDNPDSLVGETVQVQLDGIAELCKSKDEFEELMAQHVTLELLLIMTFFSKECIVNCLISLVPQGKIIEEPTGEFYIQYSGCHGLILHSFEAEDPFDDAPEDWIGPVKKENPSYRDCFNFIEVSPLKDH